MTTKTVKGLNMLLTVKELADQLHIKSATLYAWAAGGKIPCVKLHGLVRFRLEDIERWIESCQVPTNPRISHRATSGGSAEDLDRLIARAKEQAYHSRRRGNQTDIKSHRKRGA